MQLTHSINTFSEQYLATRNKRAELFYGGETIIIIIMMIRKKSKANKSLKQVIVLKNYKKYSKSSQIILFKTSGGRSIKLKYNKIIYKTSLLK